ncbi:MAG: PaaI family thioesterase [Oscillospiraceae bacterium]|jgi:acyl-CoA thioesterase|nr:PaaI family thioesterase [Oscillospiraceae bacterium]
MKDIESAAAFFGATDRFAVDVLGAEIERVGDGYAVVGLTLRDKHRRVENAVQGGVIFTLGDYAFAVATNDEDTRVVSLSNTINFHKQPKGGRLLAEARQESRGNTVQSYLVRITDELGTLVATMSVTGYTIHKRT